MNKDSSANPPTPGWTPAQTYEPGTAPSQQHVIIGVTSAPPVGPEPTRVTCPSCRAEVLTSLKHEPTTKTHLMALCLFCFV